MPEGATERVQFDGRTTTKRSVAMIKEAAYLFRLRGGGTRPKMTQGGYSTAVTASSGTHAKDAQDWGTRWFSLTRAKLWEWCIWEVGFAAWRRTYLAGVWPAHTHALPKEGELSEAAERQIVQWYQGDDALKSDRPYPRILSSGFVARTWEKYLALRPSGTVDLSGVRAAFTAGEPDDANDVEQIQRALNHFLDSKLLVDGIPGPATKGVYATYQSRLYDVPLTDPDADGLPGAASLRKLGFEVLP